MSLVRQVYLCSHANKDYFVMCADTGVKSGAETAVKDYVG